MVNDNVTTFPFIIIIPFFDSDHDKQWEFKPSLKVKIGDILTGGDIFGTVFENNLFKEHRVMVPPKSQGKVKSIAVAGMYTVNEPVIELELHGQV